MDILKKIIYIECTKLSTFFKKLCTMNVKNCEQYLKKLFALNCIELCTFFLKICVY